MARRKIAVIGNSGSGRSSSVKMLGGDLAIAEMDVHFDTRVSPPYEQVLKWILKRTEGQDVVDMSAHIQMLRDMTDAKRNALHADRFSQILFVYLYNSDPEKRRQFLEQPNARGHRRRPENIELTLTYHDAVYEACKDLADVTINTTHIGIKEVATLIDGLRHAVIEPS